MSFLVFWAVTAALALLEWLGSWCFASAVPGLSKGLISDLLAATVMVIVGLAFGTVGSVVKLQCTLPNLLIEEFASLQTDIQECQEYGASIISFGDMIKSTFGMNSIIAALVLYFVFKGGGCLIKKLIER